MTKPDIIASVGAGRMGRGIAITFALAGFEVRLVDLKQRSSNEFQLLQESASIEIQTTLSLLRDIGLMDRQTIASAASRVRYFNLANSVSALADATLIFEAVPETLTAKEAALIAVSNAALPSAIVASTTSTILSDQLQAFVSHPSRFLNAHWLNPAFLVPLVELSPASKTDPVVVERLKTLLEAMGKVPVVCAASPGYIVPRIQTLAMNEAARMVEEGVATVNDIDKATKYGFGFRFAILGLLEFIDWGGGDILYHASRYMTKTMQNERYASPQIIADNMENGRTGLSTQHGFLDYSALDVSRYQREKLADFIALLRHIGKLPAIKKNPSSTAFTDAPEPMDGQYIVQQYLNAMERRDLEKAQSYLHRNFLMTFPGNNTFSSLQQLVDWSKTRYQSIGKTYERFDQSHAENETIVYCFGTLHGVGLDGSQFSNVRFVDRFVLEDGLIQSQLVWNDLAESQTA